MIDKLENVYYISITEACKLYGMTAKEAKELAEKQSLSGIDEIYEGIKTNATQGRTVLWWYEDISSAVIRELESNGYGVSYIPDRDGDFYKISWV